MLYNDDNDDYDDDDVIPIKSCDLVDHSRQMKANSQREASSRLQQHRENAVVQPFR